MPRTNEPRLLHMTGLHACTFLHRLLHCMLTGGAIFAADAAILARLVVTRHAPTIIEKAIVRLFWDPGMMVAIWLRHSLKKGKSWTVSIINDDVAMSMMPFADCG